MPNFNTLALKILSDKYFAAGETTPEQLFMRVAKSVAFIDALWRSVELGQSTYVTPLSIELLRYTLSEQCIQVKDQKKFLQKVEEHKLTKTYEALVDKGMDISTNEQSMKIFDEFFDRKVEEYYTSMMDMDFMPGTPTLINIGRPIGMLSSCFYLEIDDSMTDIFEKVKDVALISKAGGGVGLGISKLRPEGTPVGDTNGTSSGPISFLKVFNETGNQVQQGGIRRAALIATMRVSHPDIMKFITCKAEEGVLQNFNLSVIVDNEFMEAVSKNTEYRLWHPACKEDKIIDAQIIWNKLIEMAHKNGEPGIIFRNRTQKDDVFNNKFGDLGVNPCGEINLLPYESCNLGAINLGNMMAEIPSPTYDGQLNGTLDEQKLREAVRMGITFLDNIIEINKFPLEQIQEWTEKTRRLGLGVMGLHDLMLKLKIKYGSDESISLISQIYSIIKSEASYQSTLLGETRGVPYTISEYAEPLHKCMRNAGLLAAQPTGTVAMICNQASSGIEPVFQFEYGRKDSYGKHEIQHFIKQQYGENLPPYAVTALDIPAQTHVEVQAALQKFIDNAISKTVNLPNDATIENVAATYTLAYESNCKSITVYRSGSRKEEVLSTIGKNQPVVPVEKIEQISQRMVRDRPRVLFGATTRINTPGGKAYITVNEDDDGVREVFVHISKAGSETNTHVEAEGRLISNSLKYRVPPNDIIGHLKGHKSNPILDCGKSIKSVPDAVAIAMQEYLDSYEGFSTYIEEEVAKIAQNTPINTDLHEISGELCPECGEVLYMAGGCTECTSCGFSRCG